MKGKSPTRIQLKELDAGSVRFLSGPHVHLGEVRKKTTTITILRTGAFSHPRYGRFEITRELFEGMVRNFDARTYGQDIFMDVGHRPQDGAAGEIKKLFIEGNRLRATVEWTEYGIEAIRKRGFKYISADFIENWIDNEHEQEHGPVLFGAALVTRPHIKNMDAVQLSEDDGATRLTFIHPRTLDQFRKEEQNMKKHLAALLKKLQELKLSEAIIKQLTAAFEAAAKQLADDSDQLKQLREQFEATGVTLSEQLADIDPDKAVEIKLGDININATPSEGEDLETLVAKKLAEAEAARRKAAASAAEKLEGLRKVFSDTIDEAEGLSDDTVKQLAEAAELITGDMSEEQVRKLAEHQLAIGHQLEASRKLQGAGYTPAASGANGSPRIQFGEDQSALQLQEQINNGLRQSSSAPRLRAPDEKSLHPFVKKVLGVFDAQNARRLHEEAKQFGSGEVDMASTDLPVGFQRTVIREALSDLNVLDLVNGITDPTATATTQIPYELRDTSQVVADGVVYEGQGIPAAGIEQKMDLAYIVPMKLALKISNEVIHFSRASGINWDAYGRNVESNARYMRELIARRICNEYQRSADAYLAQSITNENVAGQLDGSTSIIKTAQFPIVRPHQYRDLQGNAVGSEENPIAVSVSGSNVPAWDGTGNQAAGTYYRVTSFNLGYIQLVNEAGVPQTPSAATATVSYSYATNIQKFDLDNGSTELTVHLNGLLRAIGSRKAVLSGDRLVKPDFLLMSPTLNDTCTNAEQFTASGSRSGSSADAMGDLERIKGVNAWGTNAPGVDLGDERIIIGQRGTCTYSVAKPFVTGAPFEAVDANGRPTGQKVAYGEEYSAIKTPTPIRGRLTSVIAYSASGR